METAEIKTLIEKGLPGAQVEVDGDGTHFTAIVVSEAFAGVSMLAQHRMVYDTLGGRVGGEIHALSVRTFTPGQWEKQKELKVVQS